MGLIDSLSSCRFVVVFATRRYYNNEGISPEKGTRVLMGQFPGGPPAYFEHLERRRTEGTALDPFDLA